MKPYQQILAVVRKLGMPFLADPPEVNPNFGVGAFPGFHTTSDIDIAATYAIGKVMDFDTEEPNDINVAHVTDYPVVVSTMMEGFEKLIDYDAKHFVEKTLEKELKFFREEEIKDIQNATDDEIVIALQGLGDGVHMEYPESYVSPGEQVSQRAFDHMQAPLMFANGVLTDEELVKFIRDYDRTKKIPDNFLMEITRQYRYEQDVPDENVVSVWYVTPIATENLDYEQLDEGEINAMEEAWAGFDFVDIYGFALNIKYTHVFGDKDNKNVEYHGTTYKRLLQAIPEIANNLEQPPNPPYIG